MEKPEKSEKSEKPEKQQTIFNITTVSREECVKSIAEVTHGFHLNSEYVGRLIQTIYSKMGIIKGTMAAPWSPEVRESVVGPKGRFFKLTTVNCDVIFIWHDKTEHEYVFFGSSKRRVVQAMHVIKNRIKTCSQRHQAIIDAQEPAFIQHEYDLYDC